MLCKMYIRSKELISFFRLRPRGNYYMRKMNLTIGIMKLRKEHAVRSLIGLETCMSGRSPKKHIIRVRSGGCDLDIFLIQDIMSQGHYNQGYVVVEPLFVFWVF